MAMFASESLFCWGNFWSSTGWGGSFRMMLELLRNENRIRFADPTWRFSVIHASPMVRFRKAIGLPLPNSRLKVEILSLDDRGKNVLHKVSEFLDANVLTVAVIDPVPRRVHLFSADRESTVLNADDLLTFPDILPGFEVSVSRLFE